MKKNKFVEGTLFAYAMLLITKVIGAVYVIPLRQIIGEEGGVLYGYAYQVYQLFLDISTSGIPTAISIIIAEYNALKMFNEREFAYKVANKLITIISLVAFLAMFFLAGPIAKFFVNDINEESIPSIVLVIRVISFCLLIIPFLSITRGYLQGNRYSYASSTSQLIEQVVRVAIALIGSYVAINVLNTSIPTGVAITLSGTVLGGLAAYLYLKIKIARNKKQLMECVELEKQPKVTSTEVIKKIAVRAIPIIIIAAIQNIYNIVDLKLLMNGLKNIGLEHSDCETIASVVVTWTPKICMIINSIAASMCISIIPFVVNSFVNNDKEELNAKFNQAMSTILYISVPLAIFIAFFNTPIYNIFYTPVYYGGLILAVNAITSIFFSLQMVMDMILQGMKNYKLVYANTAIGLLVNIMLDIPIIYFLNRIGIPAYIGSIIATFIGLVVSISMILIVGNKKYELKYSSTLKVMLHILISSVIMGILIFGLKQFTPEITGRLKTIIVLGIYGALSIGLYLIITYLLGTIDLVFGKDFIKNKLKRNTQE